MFKNTGRPPALRVRGLMAGTSDLAQVPERDRDPGSKGTILAPDAPYHMTTSEHPLSETDLGTKWKDGVYLYGTLWYDDVYGQPHWIQFCDYTHGDLTQFQTCAITRMAEAGIATIMARAGHCSPKMSAYYIHIRPQAERIAMQGMSHGRKSVA